MASESAAAGVPKCKNQTYSRFLRANTAFFDWQGAQFNFALKRRGTLPNWRGMSQLRAKFRDRVRVTKPAVRGIQYVLTYVLKNDEVKFESEKCFPVSRLPPPSLPQTPFHCFQPSAQMNETLHYIIRCERERKSAASSSPQHRFIIVVVVVCTNSVKKRARERGPVCGSSISIHAVESARPRTPS